MASSKAQSPADQVTFNNNDTVQMQVGVQNVYHNVAGVRKRRYSLTPERDPAIISSLAFPQMLERRSNVKQPHRDSCEWIWEHTEFVQWQKLSIGMLWVTGKAGAGKSTLMSYLYDDFYRQRDESKYYLDFFFSSRGVELQKSPLGMLRSLLMQLFKKDNNVRNEIRRYYHDNYMGSMEDYRRLWQQPTLEKLLQISILEAANEKPVTIFIDALDEAGVEFAREISKYLHSINDQAVQLHRPVKMCISSRPHPDVKRTLSLRVRVDECNAAAISCFVDDHLNPLFSNTKDDHDRLGFATVRDMIIGQSRGLFQWVYLVVSLIESNLADGESPIRVHQWLSQTPPELEGIYTHIIEQIIQRGHAKESHMLFNWVLYSQRSLSLSEIRYAMAASMADASYRGRYEDLEDFVETNERMLKRVNTWSGNLVDIISSVPFDFGNHSPEKTQFQLQVTHKSVKDFLIEKGMYMLRDAENTIKDASDLEPGTYAIQILYKTCLAYIEHETILYSRWDLPVWALLERSPFVSHAADELLSHAEHVQMHFLQNTVGRIQGIFEVLSLFVQGSAWSLSKASRYMQIMDQPMLLHVACAANLWPVVSHLQAKSSANDMDANGMSAIHVAAMYGAKAAAIGLYKAGADISALTAGGETTLSLAVLHNRKEIYDWLLEIYSMHRAPVTALQAALCPAAATGNIQVVSFLLSQGVDVNKTGWTTWYERRHGVVASALHFAAANGHEIIVRYLLDSGARANRKSLSLAHVLAELTLSSKKWRNGHSCRILRLLLEAGADVNGYCELPCEDWTSAGNLKPTDAVQPDQDSADAFDCGDRCMTALAQAAMLRDEGLVQLLLRHGADPTAGDPGLDHIPDRSYFSSQPNLLRLLIDAGMKFDETDDSWRKSLIGASSMGDKSFVQSLLTSQRTPETVRHACSRALRYVLDSGNLEIAQVLLDNGADVDLASTVPTDDCSTPLSMSISSNQFALAKLLVSHGANVFVRSRVDRTLLHVAASFSTSKDIVQWLITLGVPLEAQDHRGMTALHVAVRPLHRGAHKEVVDTLLSAGASSSAGDLFGLTPFDYARDLGDLDIMRVMKNGIHVVRDDSHNDRLPILRRSTAILAKSLLDGNPKVSLQFNFDALSRCLMHLGQYDDACLCLQYSGELPDLSFVKLCGLCKDNQYCTTRYFCTSCCIDVCQDCFRFVKSTDNKDERCYDHEFLTANIPELSDYLPQDIEIVHLEPEDLYAAIISKNRLFLTDLVDHYQE